MQKNPRATQQMTRGKCLNKEFNFQREESLEDLLSVGHHLQKTEKSKNSECKILKMKQQLIFLKPTGSVEEAKLVTVMNPEDEVEDQLSTAVVEVPVDEEEEKTKTSN
ncbi:hypothetical protein CEXT_212251 [Caerostris extrusa]|uniref:Uncharacterized protein n=1 Tax=Caerostris extrusa TaxID=172846 RepID=A0AAV4TNC6_CAEEX|nr:hypothetical protein CEXT_212251 [Caerostris extrusa]